MRTQDLESMDFDELWLLHEELTKLLVEKIAAEKIELEKRLAVLKRVGEFARARGEGVGSAEEKGLEAERAATHPKVPPKYRNSSPPYETWSGRGKQPRWLVKALRSGRSVEDFRIVDQTGDDVLGKPAVGKA
jgi:DNA-binding protein H-NS